MILYSSISLRTNLLAIAICCSFCAFSSPMDTSQIREQYQLALAEKEQQKYAQARLTAQGAVQALDQSTNNVVDLRVGLYLLLGDCALEFSNYSQAIFYYQKTEDILATDQVSYVSLRADLFNKMGNYYNEIKEYPRAKVYLDQALELRKKNRGENHLRVADVYNNLGNCWNGMGDFSRAIEYHQEALSIRIAQLTAPHPEIAQSYNNLGLSLADQGNLTDALTAYRNAFEQYNSYYEDIHPDIADVYLNMGDIYSQQEQLDVFKVYQNQALGIYQRTKDPKDPSIANCFNNLANVFHLQNQFHRADSLYEKALNIRKQNYGETHPDVAENYYNMAWNAFYNEQSSLTAKRFQQCFKALNYVPASNGEDVFETVNDHHILLAALEGMSATTLSTESAAQLKNSLDYLNQASRLIDFLRVRYETIGSKLKLAERAYPIYDQAIQIALSLYQLTQETSYLEAAWEFAEKSKGLLLLEALKKTQAEKFAGVPQESVEAVKQMEASIGRLEKNLFLAQANQDSLDLQLIDSLNHQIFSAKRQLAERIHVLEEDYPQYYNLRYQTAIVPVDWIQENLLQQDQTLIEYFIGESQLFLFVVKKNDFQVEIVDLPENFRTWIYSLHEAIQDYPRAQDIGQNIQQYTAVARALHQILIEPIQDKLTTQLIIIPDGELGLLPFGALLTSEPEKLEAFDQYPYLINNYTISYNYSATLLKEMFGHNNTNSLKPYIGFAPVFHEGDGAGLKPLRYNQEEVGAIQKQMGGTIYTGQTATKATFLAEQADYQLVHLATHASANSSSGDFSWLAFCPAAEKKQEEAFLYVKEIYNVPTRAAMVILSACETGIGEMQRGEGIASIARSFSYAGAESLLATLWSVNDKATNQMVQLVFSGLQSGQTKDLALQSAKINYIQSSGRSKAHPYYWASFINIGNTEAIYGGFFLPYWTVGILVFFILLGAWYWMRSKG